MVLVIIISISPSRDSLTPGTFYGIRSYQYELLCLLVCVCYTDRSFYLYYFYMHKRRIHSISEEQKLFFFDFFFLHILNNLIVIKLFFFIIPLFLLPLGYKLNTMKLLITRLNVRITRNTTFRVKKEKNALRTCLRYMLSRFYIFLSFSRY